MEPVMAVTPEEMLQQGDSAWKAGNYEEALSIFSKITVQYSESTTIPIALEGMGRILLFNSHRNQGIPEFGKIDKVLEDCIKNYPATFPALRCRYLKVYTLTQQNQWDNAIEEASKVLSTYSGDSQHQDVLQNVLMLLDFAIYRKADGIKPLNH